MRVAGHPFIDTPNMDRLAREGARFTNAFATTPLCSPSRASFLTGQYPHINGIIDNTARPSHSLRVFPLELQRAGYRTGFFGKWHMGNDDSPRPDSTTGSHARTRGSHRSLVECRWRTCARQGLHNRLAHRLCGTVHGRTFGSSIPRVPGSQGHSSQCDSAGRWESGAGSGAARRLYCRRTPPRSVRRPEDASAREARSSRRLGNLHCFARLTSFLHLARDRHIR